ncbi:hypothetical protein BH11BAC5_BH11BAC5_14830 [soil metagenome]
MKQFITAAILLVSFYNASAQISKSYAAEPWAYFNNFQLFSDEQANADSAVYYLNKLASKQQYTSMLSDLLQNSFSQAFLNRDTVNESADLHQHRLLCEQILTKALADTTLLLQQQLKPLYAWKTIQENRANPIRLAELTKEFIHTQLSGEDIYTNRSGRYGLVIYQIIVAHPQLKLLADELFEKIYRNLQHNQVKLTDSMPRLALEKRAWFRYLYAYTNYIKAQQATAKEPLLKAAYDFSADLTDRNNLSGFFYEVIFLLGEEGRQSFKPDYLDYIAANSNDKKKTLAMLLETALIEPEYKLKLQSFYKSSGKPSTTFDQYWLNAINATAKRVPPATLHLTDKKQHTGKWLLVDFWGTWCGPCRAEHPALQQFYDSVIVANPKKIAIVTVACRDTDEKVQRYLSEKKYTFPVVMSDGKIEHSFSVQGYPTKLLITPQGKYIVVPFGGDWENFIKQYCNL